MILEARAVKKWTMITLFCGAHSFVWGLMLNGSILAMLAGLLTLILMFSLIESHPAYKALRTASSQFARAMDMGVRIRVYFTCYILVWWAIATIGNFWRMGNPLFFVSALPYMAELWIGMGANWLCMMLTGITLESGVRNYERSVRQSGVDNFIATYATTIFTGLMHTAILALLCGAIYAVLRWRARSA